MKRRRLAITAAAVLLALGGCRISRDLTAPPAGTVFVDIKDDFFAPDTVRVERGRSVRWVNKGTVVHTVSADSASWNSPLLSPDWWFQALLEEAGTFDYRCTLHEGMTGTVVVE